MTDAQLLTIIVTIVGCNIALLSAFASVINSNVNNRISDLRSLINERFDRFYKDYDSKIKELEQRISQLERRAS